jgi:hypothetical protein
VDWWIASGGTELGAQTSQRQRAGAVILAPGCEPALMQTIDVLRDDQELRPTRCHKRCSTSFFMLE